MTCYLKIATKLTHPSLNTAPLWPDNHPPHHRSLHPVMKCKLLPLYIPLTGMSQLPCKLESGGLVIVFCQTKAVSKQEWSSFQPLVSWAYRLRGRREASAALSPGWSASRLGPGAPLYSPSSFLSFCRLCAGASVYEPMCRPSGCCQTDHGSCCELALLSVSTYRPLLCKKKLKTKVKERRETGEGRREFTTGNWNECVPRRAQNMSARELQA